MPFFSLQLVLIVFHGDKFTLARIPRLKVTVNKIPLELGERLSSVKLKNIKQELKRKFIY